ncbi:MAG TPA: GntG family PLP-dependent aldolase [Steroidobacteraceae bacterium]|nr:GntG family PLP-dependent aldolase [Steroidobacteraceae bacterium]
MENLRARFVDCRSDTVTRPTAAMLDAMLHAQVGDDVLGEDESVNALQSQAATLFGMEAALFCPTGTMCNQIGIKVHTQPGDEVICHELAHIYLFEGGGIAFHSGASVRLLSGNNGRFTAEQVRSSINRRDDSHLPFTRLVALENTVNKGGGACWDLEEIRRIRSVCDEQGLALHLDGARLFNALVARGEAPHQYGKLFDTISVCLSKGLGTPAGSLLLGSKSSIARAHRLRKVMGGGMRQAGYLAAAGSYALEHHVRRLQEDHAKAQTLGRELQRLSCVSEVLPVETNIVIARLAEGISTDDFLSKLSERGVRAGSMGAQLVRFVFHLDVADADMELLCQTVRRLH